MKIHIKKLFLLILPLFFLLPMSAQAAEENIDGSTLYTYQSTETDGAVFLRGTNGIIYPQGATKIDKIYIFFHGLNPPFCNTSAECHSIGPEEVCKEFKLCQKINGLQENVAILIPQMRPRSGNHRNDFKKEMFEKYKAEALKELHSKISNSPNDISVVAGHSAGAGVIIRYSELFPNVDEALVFDGCYDVWCKIIIESKQIKKKQIYIATAGDFSINKGLAEASDTGAKVHEVKKTGHYQVPGKCFLDHVTNDNCDSTAEPTKAETKLDNLLDQINAAKPKLEINFPELHLSDVSSITDDTGTYIFIPWIAQFISTLYKFGVGITSIVAVIIIILQGVRIIISGGGEHKAEGYKKITHALIGLLIAWGSFAILYNINPNLIEFNALKIKVVAPEPLPEDSDNLEPQELEAATQQANIKTIKPTWNSNTFDCSKKDTYEAAGVAPENIMVEVKCPGIIGDNIKVVPQMKDPLCKVGALAVQNGYQLWVGKESSYRGFKAQKDGWCDDLKKYNNDPKETKKYRAVPGFSNHGLGIAIDVTLAKKDAGGKFIAQYKINSKTQCQASQDAVRAVADLFYKSDPNFVRYDNEIWHFEYGTATTIPQRSKTYDLPAKCK